MRNNSLALFTYLLLFPLSSSGQALNEKQAPSSDSQPPSGLNDSFLDPELDVAKWLKRFEVESREVYSHRKAIVAACGIKPGMRIADIGAGTGLFTRLFAKCVGDDGWVFAVDISPKFLQHISHSARTESLVNVSPVLGQSSNISLPAESVDLVFVCDTYHHFEFPEETLRSIYKSLKPRGTLVIVDFDRIPGKSREWILGHVRAGKSVVRQEIEAAGFGLLEDRPLQGLAENYFLKFQKR